MMKYTVTWQASFFFRLSTNRRVSYNDMVTLRRNDYVNVGDVEVHENIIVEYREL